MSRDRMFIIGEFGRTESTVYYFKVCHHFPVGTEGKNDSLKSGHQGFRTFCSGWFMVPETGVPTSAQRSWGQVW